MNGFEGKCLIWFIEVKCIWIIVYKIFFNESFINMMRNVFFNGIFFKGKWIFYRLVLFCF